MKPDRPETADGREELSAALALSFRALRVALLFLGLLYLVSGVFRVPPDQRALVRVWGRWDGRVREPGLQLTWPRPFAEVIRVETARVRTVEADPDPLAELAPPPGAEPPADPPDEWTRFLLASDAGLVRVHAALRYTVADPAAWCFRWTAPATALTAELRRALTAAAARTSSDELLRAGLEPFRAGVQDAVADRAARLGLGVRIEGVDLVAVRPPRAVAPAFEDVLRAANERGRAVGEARTEAARILLDADAEAARRRGAAEAARQRTVAETQADADAFTRLLPRYRARPSVVARTLWQDALRRALAATRQTYWIRRRADGSQELRLWLGPEAPAPSRPAQETPR